jgi:hypothetical protein
MVHNSLSTIHRQRPCQWCGSKMLPYRHWLWRWHWRRRCWRRLWLYQQGSLRTSWTLCKNFWLTRFAKLTNRGIGNKTWRPSCHCWHGNSNSNLAIVGGTSPRSWYHWGVLICQFLSDQKKNYFIWCIAQSWEHDNSSTQGICCCKRCFELGKRNQSCWCNLILKVMKDT